MHRYFISLLHIKLIATKCALRFGGCMCQWINHQICLQSGDCVDGHSFCFNFDHTALQPGLLAASTAKNTLSRDWREDHPHAVNRVSKFIMRHGEACG